MNEYQQQMPQQYMNQQQGYPNNFNESPYSQYNQIFNPEKSSNVNRGGHGDYTRQHMQGGENKRNSNNNFKDDKLDYDNNQTNEKKKGMRTKSTFFY